MEEPVARIAANGAHAPEAPRSGHFLLRDDHMAELGEPRAHVHRDASVDERLLALAVHARGVERVLKPHADVDRVDESVEDAARDPVAARAA